MSHNKVEEGGEQTVNELVEVAKGVWVLAGLLVASAAWIAYAEHPTAQNLRTAIIDTLNL
jgi:hypothetical protein